MNVGSGGGAAAPAAGGASGEAAAAPEEEKKEEGMLIPETPILSHPPAWCLLQLLTHRPLQLRRSPTRTWASVSSIKHSFETNNPVFFVTSGNAWLLGFFSRLTGGHEQHQKMGNWATVGRPGRRLPLSRLAWRTY